MTRIKTLIMVALILMTFPLIGMSGEIALSSKAEKTAHAEKITAHLKQRIKRQVHILKQLDKSLLSSSTSRQKLLLSTSNQKQLSEKLSQRQQREYARLNMMLVDLEHQSAHLRHLGKTKESKQLYDMVKEVRKNTYSSNKRAMLKEIE